MICRLLKCLDTLCDHLRLVEGPLYHNSCGLTMLACPPVIKGLGPYFRAASSSMTQ